MFALLTHPFVTLLIGLAAGFGVGRITPSNLKKDLASAQSELAALKAAATKVTPTTAG